MPLSSMLEKTACGSGLLITAMVALPAFSLSFESAMPLLGACVVVFIYGLGFRVPKQPPAAVENKQPEEDPKPSAETAPPAKE